MNEKNSFGLDYCFRDLENPLDLFSNWFNEAKNTEINDPNAVALSTADKKGVPTVRMVLLKDFNQNGFVFYTNLNSKKSQDIRINPNASMCFHWKTLLRQIRINGKISKVLEKDADNYYGSRPYDSKISAWASNQSAVLKNRDELFKSIEEYKKKYSNTNNVPRPDYWSGWNLDPYEIEFWLQKDSRMHERLKYVKKEKTTWERFLLNP